MHSHGFAQVQNQHYRSDGCGNIPGSFADQQAADERRRYAQGYENARIMRGAHVAERARAYIPRTHSGFGGRDTSGDGFSGSLIGRGLQR